MKVAHLLLLSCLMLSCSKEEPELFQPLPLDLPVLEIKQISTADAVLQATYMSTIETNSLGTYTDYKGKVMATFNTLSGNTATVQSISCEGESLVNKSGVYKNSSELGPDFGSSVLWAVKGRGDVPDFNYEMLYKVPEIGDVSLRDSLNHRDTLALLIALDNPFTNLGLVDSITYTLRSINGSIHKATTKIDSVYFLPEELKVLGQGQAYIEVQAMKTEFKTISSYKLAFLNSGFFYKNIWVY